jgi:luciferase family oxidoreductase group 1
MKAELKKGLAEIPLSILDLALVLEGKSPVESFKNSLTLAQKAEAFGYNRFWLAEHHNMESVASAATSVLIGFIAGGTSAIRVGSGGIMLPNHAPLIVAEQFGTLATLYPNRIDLGLGRAPGTDPVTARALRRDAKAALEFPENVQELRAYLSLENKNSAVRAIPGEGLNIPIWILGSSTDSAYLAAAFGLPYAFASHFAPAQLLQAIAIYRKNFRPSDQLGLPYVMAGINVIAADSDEEATFLATSAKMHIMGILTGERRLLQAPVKDFTLSRLEESALRQMTAYSFIGSPETIQDQLQDFINETQADELIVNSAVYDIDARIRSYKLLREIR